MFSIEHDEVTNYLEGIMKAKLSANLRENQRVLRNIEPDEKSGHEETNKTEFRTPL